MPSVKRTVKVLGAKVHVTKKDAKKLRPLAQYRKGRLIEARNSDNWFILGVGALLGFALGLLV